MNYISSLKDIPNIKKTRNIQLEKQKQVDNELEKQKQRMSNYSSRIFIITKIFI